MPDRVCVGVIVGAHGVRGAVRIKSFTENPADLMAYGPVEDEAGRLRFRLSLIGETKAVLTARLDGVDDRTAAEALKGVKLFVARSALPPADEGEFYYSDLVGLRAEAVDGTGLGQVIGVFDFGGGDIIEVSGPAGTAMYPFTRAVVPVVDIAGGRLVIDPPFETEARQSVVRRRGPQGAGSAKEDGGDDGV
jgi:16S rRNA processing protein RimM